MPSRSYTRLKEKLEGKEKENLQLQAELAKLREGKGKPKGIPDFIFTHSANNLDIYNFLKDRPTASEFVYSKFRDNQMFISELCDPKNPIYLPEVKENLKGIQKYEVERKSLEELQRERREISKELPLIKQEKVAKEAEFNELQDDYNSLYEEKEKISKFISNLRQDVGYSQVSGFIEKVHTVMMDIKKKWNPKPGFEKMTLVRNEVSPLLDLLESADSLSNLLSNTDLLTSELLDKMRKELQDEMKRVEGEVNLFRDRNPWGVVGRIRKSTDAIRRETKDFRREVGVWTISDQIVNIESEVSKLEAMKK